MRYLRLALFIPVALAAFVACGDGGQPASIPGPTVTAAPTEGAISTAGAPAPGKIAFASDRDGNLEIYVMDTNGSNVARLTDNPGPDITPAWSPDGQRIAFGRPYPLRVYVMNSDGSGVTRLSDGASPVWSPDGTRIAFEWQREIYLMSPTGSNRIRLTDTPEGYAFSPVWSPDGTRIAFASSRIGQASDVELYTINADGSGLDRLTNDARQQSVTPTWSPDGTRIAFVRGADIYAVNADGTNDGRLVENAHSPAWSPDGTRIAFVSERDGNDEIYVMNADGSGQTRLTDNLAHDNFPAWSPVP